MTVRIVQLVSCDDEEYRDFATRQIVEYATQLARAGEVSSEQSLSTARERLIELTADRLRPNGHEFLVARSTQDALRVGWAWLSPPPPFLGPGHECTRWLSQLTVEESQRCRGWGRAILHALEDHARDCSYQTVWLRVFDWNVGALHLYHSQGYRLARKFTVDAHLCKQLMPRERLP